MKYTTTALFLGAAVVSLVNAAPVLPVPNPTTPTPSTPAYFIYREHGFMVTRTIPGGWPKEMSPTTSATSTKDTQEPTVLGVIGRDNRPTSESVEQKKKKPTELDINDIFGKLGPQIIPTPITSRPERTSPTSKDAKTTSTSTLNFWKGFLKGYGPVTLPGENDAIDTHHATPSPRPVHHGPAVLAKEIKGLEGLMRLKGLKGPEELKKLKALEVLKELQKLKEPGRLKGPIEFSPGLQMPHHSNDGKVTPTPTPKTSGVLEVVKTVTEIVTPGHHHKFHPHGPGKVFKTIATVTEVVTPTHHKLRPNPHPIPTSQPPTKSFTTELTKTPGPGTVVETVIETVIPKPSIITPAITNFVQTHTKTQLIRLRPVHPPQNPQPLDRLYLPLLLLLLLNI
jgi:hypothetical protein